MTEQQAEGQPFWMRMSNEDIACELSATFDLGLLVTRCIAAWILDEDLDEYLEEWTAEAESLPPDTVLGITKKEYENSLEMLMRKANLQGISVMVRCDPYRDHDCFTIMVGKGISGNEYRVDTDKPSEVLADILTGGK